MVFTKVEKMYTEQDAAAVVWTRYLWSTQILMQGITTTPVRDTTSYLESGLKFMMHPW